MSIFRRNRKEARLIVFFGTLKFLICLVFINNYGFQRDEFLHIALAQHLSWGYLEVPPFIAAVSWISTHLFGDSVVAARIIPSLFGALTVYLAGLMVLAMGGKRFAISVACLGILLSPAFLASGYLLQPVVFDQFFWALAAFLLIQYIKTRKTSYLYWMGAIAGLGMLNKYTMLLYAASLLIGILVSSQRKALLTAHLAGAVTLGLLVFLPNLLWQVQHNFPLLKHLNELNKTQLEHIHPLDFIKGQLFIHLTGVLIWLPGFIYLFFSRIRSRYIFISFAFVTVVVLLAVLHGKVYYSFGAFPALFAAGGLAWQRAMTRLSARFQYLILAVVLAPCIAFAPVVAPILKLDDTLHFFEFTKERLGFTLLTTWEDRNVHPITQDYADMLGWEEMTALVNTAWSGLNAAERMQTSIVAANYGQAGAVDHLGKRYRLPRVVSLSSSYVLWSPSTIKYQTLIVVDDEPEDLVALYGSAVKIGEVRNSLAREKGTAVWLLKSPKVNVNDVYRKLRQEEMASMISY